MLGSSTKVTLAILSTIALLAWARSPESRRDRNAQDLRADTTALVVVDRPTAIGFFRPAKDSVEAAEDEYSEGIAHVQFALEDAKACLGRDSSQTLLVVDTAVHIRQGGRIQTLRFSRVDSLSYGIYLIAVGAALHLVTANGPSALSPAVAEEIPPVFHRPPCRDDDAP